MSGKRPVSMRMAKCLYKELSQKVLLAAVIRNWSANSFINKAIILTFVSLPNCIFILLFNILLSNP